VTAQPAPMAGPVRLSCGPCGAVLYVAGQPEMVRRLTEGFEAAHPHEAPGHGPATWPPSEDGREPRRPAATRRKR
jgi:hypothetical protein